MMKNVIKPFLAFFLLCFFTVNIMSQNIKVSGNVQDVAGPVIGASVVVKGTNNGTVTDLDGNFVLKNVPPKATLVISFIGYVTEQINVRGRESIQVTMREDSQMLSEVEVVAVGYGDVRRRDLTGSIAKANVDDLVKNPVSNVAEALGGRVAGVQVTSTDGGLDDNFNIVIRGSGSLTQSTAPLYVVDGFPMEESGMSAINPNDIESIDFLKDASATAIYGSRGANGVVIINTKGGVSGKPTVTYNGSVTVSNIRNKMDLMDGYEFVLLQQDLMTEEDFSKYYLQNGLTLEDYKTMPNYDWQDEVYRTAISHNHYVNLSGGNNDLKYTTSLSYSDKQGIIINSGLKKYQGRFKISQKIKNFKIDANANFSSNVQDGANPSQSGSTASNSLMYSIWAYRPVSPSGSDLMESLYDEDVDMTNDYRFNPVLSARNEYRHSITNQLSANLGVEWEIIKNFKLKVTGGYSANDRKREEFNGSQTKTGNSHPNNTASKGINAKLQINESRSYLNENTLTYSLSKKKHSFNALLGVTFQKTTSSYYGITTEYITSEAFGMSGLNKGAAPVVDTSMGENAMMSYLGRVNYNYASKYYVNFTMRADGSSKFAKGNRWGYFPSASLAWTFSREDFVKDKLTWLSNGKLRLSWGLTGNNRIGDYDYLSQYITDNNYYKYPWNGSFTTGFVSDKMANSNLKWETTEQYNVGLDLGFLDGRFNLIMDYYIKNTRDLLIDADVSATSGYTNAMVNIGKLRNEGFEFTLESMNIRSKDFVWSSNFNIAFNHNEIVSLNSGQDYMQSFVSWDNQYKQTPAYISMIGNAAGRMYGFIYDGTYKYDDFNIVIDENGTTTYKLKDGIPYYTVDQQPGDPKYKDIAGNDGKITDADRTVIGDGQPIFTGGFNNNFTYKNWDLNIFLQWSYGNDILNANRLEFENAHSKRNKNMFASYTERWTPDNPYSDMPRAQAKGSEVYSSLYVEDGSYLKLKNISLGYTFPKRLIKPVGISSLRMYLAAENIATLTSYSGSDPEVSTRHSILTPGFDWSAYPRSFNASFGINISF